MEHKAPMCLHQSEYMHTLLGDGTRLLKSQSNRGTLQSGLCL